MEEMNLSWYGSYIEDSLTGDLYTTESVDMSVDEDGRLISQMFFSNRQWVTKGFSCHETGFLAYSIETLAN